MNVGITHAGIQTTAHLCANELTEWQCVFRVKVTCSLWRANRW